MKKIIWSLILIITLSCFDRVLAQTLNLDLSWETNGYTPSEYSGKTLAVVGSTIRVIAYGGSKDWSYYWRLDDYELPDYSGLNKNSFSFKATKTSGQTHLVSLIVKSGDQNILTRNLEIPIVDPILIFYEQDPLLGENFNYSFTGTYNLIKPEITFVAEPFFFNRQETNNLKYTWKLNGQTVASDGGNGRVITFTTPTNGGKGTNKIELLAENPANALQYVQNSFSLIFNSHTTNDATF